MASLGAPGCILVPSTLFPFPLLVPILFLSWRKFIWKDLGKFWVLLTSVVKDLLVEFIVLLPYDCLLCLCLENYDQRILLFYLVSLMKTTLLPA